MRGPRRRIKQRAGHASFSTTEGYIREAENLRETNCGEPFPPLPEELVGRDSARLGGSSLVLPKDETRVQIQPKFEVV